MFLFWRLFFKVKGGIFKGHSDFWKLKLCRLIWKITKKCYINPPYCVFVEVTHQRNVEHYTQNVDSHYCILGAWSTLPPLAKPKIRVTTYLVTFNYANYSMCSESVFCVGWTVCAPWMFNLNVTDPNNFFTGSGTSF